MAQLFRQIPRQTINTESAGSQRQRGKLAREAIPRESLGEFISLQRDPIQIIEEQDRDRLPELVPLRHTRMAESPFTFFRGTAAIMAADLAVQNQTDTHLVICGDAHINNFGLFNSPERRLMFDLNDFDEAAPGPWEWDVRRLLTSAVLASREIGSDPSSQEETVLRGAKVYRESLAKLLKLPSLQRVYYSIDETALADRVRGRALRMLDKQAKKARRRDSDREIERSMEPDRMGFIRFKDDPPVLMHLIDRNEEEIQDLARRYRESTLPEIGFLLSRFSLTDVARRVVGVGSVGTRCFVMLLTGPEGKGLILQSKQAQESVVTRHLKPNLTTPQTLPEGMPNGQRVVNHQRILQAVSDPFLGHVEMNGADFFVRQFRDAKGSFDTSAMDEEELEDYVALCAHLLARAHSQSPLAHWVSGYLGKSTKFDRAMTAWAFAYADQSELDYKAFLEAIESGRLTSDSEEESHSEEGPKGLGEPLN